MPGQKSRDGAPDRLTSAAAQLGTALGHLAGRVDEWRAQRDELASELRRQIAAAEDLLAALAASAAPKPVRPASRPTVQGVRRGHERGRTLSAAERRQQHADWELQRRERKLHEHGVGKKGTHAKKAVVRPLMEK